MADEVNDSTQEVTPIDDEVTPPPPEADTVPDGPVQVPDNHPLVTALAAQKAKTGTLQAEVDKIPSLVASSLREHLVGLHSIDDATASTLITGTTPEAVIAQVNAVTGLSSHQPPPSAPLEGTRTSGDGGGAQSEFLGKLFSPNAD